MQQSIDIHTRTRSHSQIHKSIDFSQCPYFLIWSRCERRRVGYRDAAVDRHTHTDALALTNTQVDRLLPMSMFSNSEPLSMPSPWQQRVWPRRLQRCSSQHTNTDTHTLTLTNTDEIHDYALPMVPNLGPPSMLSPWQQRVWPRQRERSRAAA